MGHVIALAFTAAANPTLIAVSTLLLLLPSPKRLMLGYLCGALMTSITLGLVIVFALDGSGAAKTTQHTLNPWADVALGTIALVLAIVLGRGRDQRAADRRAHKRAEKDKPPPRWQQAISKGSARTTFVIGAVLTLPGASYLVGLHAIHELHYSTVATVLLVVGFNIVMLMLLEIPLAGYVFAPERTPQAIDRAKAWIGGHWHRFAFIGLTLVGVLLVTKGAIGLSS